MHNILSWIIFLARSTLGKSFSSNARTLTKPVALDSFFDSCLRLLAVVTFCMALYAIVYEAKQSLLTGYKSKKDTQKLHSNDLTSEEKKAFSFLEQINSVQCVPSSTESTKTFIQGQSQKIPELRQWYLSHHPYLDLDHPESIDGAVQLDIFKQKCEDIYGLEFDQLPLTLQRVFQKSILFTQAIKSMVFDYCNEQRWIDIRKL
ncbi:hypothetical protein HMI54_013804 [Coelomomyces lativittatus]|nr:hypothetical protein HMI56_005789 [Coelomomyces lativittatus]KAJ1514640.1 hypothetical protein HMI54_013804 [Coelomomyces lativittatus]